MAALTGRSGGTASRTLAITLGVAAPNDPSAGFLTSTMSTAPATATRASWALVTLTSSFTRAHARAAGGEAHELHPPTAGQLGLHATDQVAPRRLACHHPVDGGPPRALAHAGRPETQQGVDQSAGARVVDTALNRSERLPDEPLEPGERSAELRQVAIGEPGKQRGQDELRDERSAGGVRAQARERVLLGLPRESRLGAGDGEHAVPVVGHRMADQQRGRLLDAGANSALHHQSAEDERPQAHRRPPATPGRARNRQRLGGLPGQRGDGGRDGECELRARAEADMRGNRLEHADPGTARKPERLATTLGNDEGARSVRALHGELVARARLDHRRRTADRHAQPAEPARAAAADGVQHAQMQPRRGLDADRSHSPPARTWLRTSSIASRSRGPAVLSTRTWRRASSARISAAGSRRAREAMIDASSTAWRARLKPRNSRPAPCRATRVVTC